MELRRPSGCCRNRFAGVQLPEVQAMGIKFGFAVAWVLLPAPLYGQGPTVPTAPLVAPSPPMRSSTPPGPPARPQRVPDLSGTWVLQSKQKGPDIPLRVVIDQFLAR